MNEYILRENMQTVTTCCLIFVKSADYNTTISMVCESVFLPGMEENINLELGTKDPRLVGKKQELWIKMHYRSIKYTASLQKV
jgi:hypothetical protein